MTSRPGSVICDGNAVLKKTVLQKDMGNSFKDNDVSKYVVEKLQKADEKNVPLFKSNSYTINKQVVYQPAQPEFCKLNRATRQTQPHCTWRSNYVTN